MIQLTSAMREQFETDGFFITDVLFDDATTAGLKAAFEQDWQRNIAAAEATGDAKRAAMVRERPFLSGLAQRDDVCRQFLIHPNLLAVAEQMIGPDADNTYNQAVIKPPAREVNNYFAWHQDGYYSYKSKMNSDKWDADRMLDLSNGFQCWVAVSRTTVANGTLWVIPGMHNQGWLPHEWNEDAREWVAQIDTSGKMAVELQPGQMLVFSLLTPHYSGPNTSDETRMVYQFGMHKPGTSNNELNFPVMRGGEPVES